MLAAKIVEPMPTPVTKDAFRNAMSVLASAVNVVTTDGPAGRAGFTATAGALATLFPAAECN